MASKQMRQHFAELSQAVMDVDMELQMFKESTIRTSSAHGW
jgi:hypothetical protein